MIAKYQQVKRLTTDTILAVTDLSFAIDDNVILQNLELRIPAGSFCCLLGNSGSGKTTLLRLLAGLQAGGSGRIELDGQCLMQQGRALVAPQHRGIGMVFQDYALFPNLSVAENLLFGMPKCTRITQRQTIQRLLSLIDLVGFEQRFPHQLSGGQQQRIALARSLAASPKFMLLDEPFSNLDQEQRLKIAQHVKRILKQQQITTLMVTHDQREALMIADYVGVLVNGRLLQWDTPYALYHRPHSRQVAEFIGEGQWLPVHVADAENLLTPLGAAVSTRSLFCNALDCCRQQPNQQLYLRAEDVELTAWDSSLAEGTVCAELSEEVFMGYARYFYITLLRAAKGFQPIDLSIPLLCRDPDLQVGDKVQLKWCLNEPILFADT